MLLTKRDVDVDVDVILLLSSHKHTNTHALTGWECEQESGWVSASDTHINVCVCVSVCLFVCIYLLAQNTWHIHKHTMPTKHFLAYGRFGFLYMYYSIEQFRIKFPGSGSLDLIYDCVCVFRFCFCVFFPFFLSFVSHFYFSVSRV